VFCQPQNNNAYSGSLVSGNYFPWALSGTASICDTLSTWYNSDNPGTLAWGTSLGNWVGQNNKYLGAAGYLTGASNLRKRSRDSTIVQPLDYDAKVEDASEK
jgi:hypothetical protein